MAIQKITSGIIADGAIVATDIADGTVTGPKLGQNAVSSNNIVSVSNTAIAGLIQAAQIGSVSNTALSGVIEVAQLADTLNLASKTVTLPAGVGGKVLQSVTASFTTLSTSSTSSGTSAPEWGSVTITPTTSGNYLYVTFSGVCEFATACKGESRAYLTYSATGVSETIAQQLKSGNQTSDLRTIDAFGMTTRITTVNTNTYTIRVRANGKDIFDVGKSTDWIFGQIVVLEIAA